MARTSKPRPVSRCPRCGNLCDILCVDDNGRIRRVAVVCRGNCRPRVLRLKSVGARTQTRKE
jgi:hypothetical protein